MKHLIGSEYYRRLSAVYCLLIILLFFPIFLLADIEIIDEDDVISEDEHQYELSDETDLAIKYHLYSNNRYSQKYHNLKMTDRFTVNIADFTIKTLYEYNTKVDNPKYPYGMSILYKNTKKNTLAVGQYQISHGYGLLLGKSSFISQKPNINADFTQNNTSLSANPRPYFNPALFGVAYQHHISPTFSFLLFSSLKDTGVKLDGDRIIEYRPTETLPTNTATHFYSGGILNLNVQNLRLSSLTTFSQANKETVDEIKPLATSLAGSYKYSDYLLFTENAYAHDKLAHISGIKHQYQKFSQLLVYRNFSQGYQSEYANYISRLSMGNEEKGIFYKVAYTHIAFAVQTFGDIYENPDRPGVYWGLQVAKYSLLGVDDMALSARYMESYDTEWRNLSGITAYEQRKREYARFSWQQCDTDFITTSLNFDFQRKLYPQYEIADHGYALGINIVMSFERIKTTINTGVFDSDIPLYMYIYSGRANNSLYVLNGDGQYGVLHIGGTVYRGVSLELMSSFLHKKQVEYTSGVMVNVDF